MAFLIPMGAIITLLGLAGLIWCIIKVNKAKKSGATDDALREVMQGIVALNLGSLLVSALGLMMVVIGILLQ